MVLYFVAYVACLKSCHLVKIYNRRSTHSMMRSCSLLHVKYTRSIVWYRTVPYRRVIGLDGSRQLPWSQDDSQAILLQTSMVTLLPISPVFARADDLRAAMRCCI